MLRCGFRSRANLIRFKMPQTINPKGSQNLNEIVAKTVQNRMLKGVSGFSVVCFGPKAPAGRFLDAFGAALGRFLAHLGPLLGGSWALLGTKLERPRASQRHLGGVLGEL